MKNFSLLIKPAGPDCNLNCKYCFYSCKSSLFGAGRHRMSLSTAEKLVKDYLALGFPQNGFAFQGGEPTLMGLDFYKSIVEFQKNYASAGQQICNSLQSNAVLLDEQWCQFLAANDFLVGISLDGPQKYHDSYRVDFDGNGTFDKVMASIENCRKFKTEFNILVLLNDRNVKAADELFDFFTSNKIKYLQFIPCVEKDVSTGRITDFSISPQEYGDFMLRIFDRWYDYGVKNLSIRLFDSMLNFIVYGHHTNCTFARKCNDYIVIEHNGDGYCCDFFVSPDYRLGNILDTPIEQLFLSDTKYRFAEYKNKINSRCIVCKYNAACRGGCLKERLLQSFDFSNKSYFCNSYKRIFEYCFPKLSSIASEHILS